MFPPLPLALPQPADPERRDRGFERWLELASATDDSGLSGFIRDAAEQPESRALLEAVFGNSPFLGQCLLREPAFLRDIMAQGPDAVFEALISGLWQDLGAEGDQARLMRGLRIGKRRTALLIALADIGKAWKLDQVTGAISLFAETAIRLACRHLLRKAAENGDFTLPYPDDPERDSGLVVIGMGKLGAGELNYSSDIDLIVFFDDEKITYTGRKSLQEAFVRLTRDLVKILEERTADGYVFRTDLRLRPDPGSTPAAVSLSAAETYYEAFGQNWERAAMIKARQVAGDEQSGQFFRSLLRPFIWRKSLDFAAIQDIHSIKRQIHAHRGGGTIAVAGHNIKLGRGGIREIEFFAQTQQLIWGGRDPEMRSPRTVEALRALAQAGHVAPDVAEEMVEAYVFLRDLEHRLQMIDDKQTQELPKDPEQLRHLAVFAGFQGIEDFSQALVRRLQRVEHHYAHLFEDAPSLSDAGNLVFTGGEDDPETLRTIAEMGFRNPSAVSADIRGWHHGRVRATRSTRARELLTELTPTLLKALSQTANPDAAFAKFNEFLSRLPAGVPLFSMFHAHPGLLDLVADIMGDAPRLAEHLARRVNLLDSVLAPGFFDPPPGPDLLGQELDKQLALAFDFQEALDICRRWTNDHKFQVGVLTLRNVIDASQAARALTDIADTVISRLHPYVEKDFARLHGGFADAGVAIIAMGKMGSREMTATSDLDLVLIYDVPDGAEESDGPKPLVPSVYFARLTQRLLTAITAKTGEGVLYEVDMRLRPSGNAGPIASSLTSFIRYHDEAAWTWEHMALTKARVISGPTRLVERIEEITRDTLCRPRDEGKLLVDVSDMRARMAKEHKGTSIWDVKHRRGGLVDIEFIAQYLQLRHARSHPSILAHGTADVLRQAVRLGLLEEKEGTLLCDALHLWTTVQSVLRQTIEGAFTEEDAPRGLKELLIRAAGASDFDSLKTQMAEIAAQVLDIFVRLIDKPAEPYRAAQAANEQK
ncbi:bifunctional [glutamine synthetase] adenylyltransferase/[glutamine synthetase]-adenylyl-L-tyrosine phosphorylase [Telmatospirillum sp. J64-1]|uniref:bifunctional [glutamine synthetase] adenylyltransferase/[glutamine synthetase]-adenylyl-L-tyrosine phosphorylase n=1 Tax=Telmatospirillum sp. J64-1 TaxID=2502183 RepID=UPI00115CE793|nr:bifunctional [glutamine synthetase] adenylyltransferase/[glutamine synthetase]-adenylyl-L-tyrosine phosphorylase [Telmatospirillum sp. J64-1]